MPYGAPYASRCRNDYDCGGTYCAEVEGGVCLPPCRSDYDCGAGYVCRSVGRHGTPGHIDVCVWH